MQESNSNLQQDIQINSDSDESEISGIPQLQKSDESITQDKYRPSGQYIKVQKTSEKIDEEGILEEWIKKQQEELKIYKKASKNTKKKTASKVPSTPSKKYDLQSIRKKWKGQMDQNIAKYKEYLKEEKQTLDGKEKEYLLEFYKVLLDGIYQLKELSEDPHNDLTSNEKKIIAPESDFHLYLKELVEKFNQAFRDAKLNNKIFHIKDKWDPLIKNCRDETNFELRRKIIRAKTKPQKVLQQNDEYLMSADAKLRAERRRMLILNEAEKNFDKPLQGPEEEEIDSEVNPEINQLPNPLESMRSISSNDHEKRIYQEKEKIEEYKRWIGDDPMILMKDRINELLVGTSSYDRILRDFNQKFQGI